MIMTTSVITHHLGGRDTHSLHFTQITDRFEHRGITNKSVNLLKKVKLLFVALNLLQQQVNLHLARDVEYLDKNDLLTDITNSSNANWPIRHTCVSGQLAADAHVSLTGLQVVDGADVVQASTGNIVSRRRIGACHHPRRAQRDGMDLEERDQI